MSRPISHQTTRLFDDMTDIPRANPLNMPDVFWFESVTSTMDTSKELVTKNLLKDNAVSAVIAESQSHGRGTRGRKWFHGDRNIFMTIIVHRKLIPIPLHLLPLRSGSLVASALLSHITTQDAEMKLKWPNDVLINNNKLCGILIEMEGDYLLIGIGCNIATAPRVAGQGSEAGRPATALAHFNLLLSQLTTSSSDIDVNANSDTGKETDIQRQQQLKEYCQQITLDIYRQFDQWIQLQSDTAAAVLDDFNRNMDYSTQRLRNDHFPTALPDSSGSEGDEEVDVTRLVQPLRLNSDGTLRVRLLHNSEEMTLVAEYLR